MFLLLFLLLLLRFWVPFAVAVEPAGFFATTGCRVEKSRWRNGPRPRSGRGV